MKIQGYPELEFNVQEWNEEHQAKLIHLWKRNKQEFIQHNIETLIRGYSNGKRVIGSIDKKGFNDYIKLSIAYLESLLEEID